MLRMGFIAPPTEGDGSESKYSTSIVLAAFGETPDSTFHFRLFQNDFRRSPLRNLVHI